MYNPFNLPAQFIPAADVGCSAADTNDGHDEFLRHRAAAVRYAAKISEFLSTYWFLLDIHHVQYLTRQPLSRLPIEWQAQLRSAPIGSAYKFLEPMVEGSPWPPAGSLLEWFALV